MLENVAEDTDTLWRRHLC